MKKGFVFIVLAVVGIAVLCGRTCGKDEASSNDVQALKRTARAFSSVAKTAMPAVVFIRVEKTIKARGRRQYRNNPFEFFGEEFYDRFFERRRQQSAPREYKVPGPAGSGFIISKDGYILTNNHVVGDADKITVRLHGGEEVEAKLIGTDPKSEVAVIKIEGEDLPHLELGDSDTLEIGEWVIAVGNPFGLTETLTVGVVSAKGRSNIGITAYEDFIQTDAAINPGNSGGPLLNIDGRVIGINTAIYSQSGGYMGIGFAIPVNMARAIKDQLISSGKVERGYLGVIIRDVDEDLAAHFGLKKAEGVLILEVTAGAEAAKAGLKHGDIILRLDGTKVEDTPSFRNAVASKAPGTKIKLTIYRTGKEREITVKTGSLLEEMADNEHAAKLFEKLGMKLEELTKEIADRFGYDVNEGLVISEIEPGGQAAWKRLRPGFLITSVGRIPVTTVKEFVAAVEETKNRTGGILVRVRGPRFADYLMMTVE